ncbi:MAG: sucrose-6-phosphate hydrolase [Liquorilactobacillus nagelii]|jgi:beta-fructofuranosidase|uniref:sucrose-6-phosphate hydrolase n=1 Tax=Liquorilactobacillus nagelii TaxID=82688 RepID=UPI00242A7061|nr:sucrose-6-phosphate hydrolase [Liquorilactobacillus nagelii]MCI1922417.1 sucrose-6-phosphate hydrolase [Liquorilactobacillus nagelii]MCI1976363.1 sucrose-6-phosphate hydrolase [Liquorilactobacillus nagelii]
MVLDNHLLRDLTVTEKKLWDEKVKQIAAQHSLRQVFHIEAPIGFLGDPNGFSFFQGEWYLFHQWIPRKTKKKMVYWRGLTSKDLVHWKSLPMTIDPDTKFDSHGAYSGSAWVNQGQLEIFYTGNVRNQENEREAYQIRATMDENGIKKETTPAIMQPPAGYTMNFRDPKVWQHAGKTYAIIGTQTKDKAGRAIIYEASTDLKTWQVKEVLQPFDHDLGYMWECPNFFELDGSQVLIFCPQGATQKDLEYHTLFPNAFVIGPKWSGDGSEWKLKQPKLALVDEGFECYASQIVQAAGRTIIISWMGPSKTPLPTEELGWSGCLSLPREMSIKDGKLYQKPIQELTSLFGTEQIIDVEHSPSFQASSASQFKVAFKGNGQVLWNIRAEKDNPGLVIKVDLKNQILEVDRQAVFPQAAEGKDERDTQRRLHFELTDDILELEIWIDHTSFEIFVNQGRSVLSGRLFTTETAQNCNFKVDGNVTVTGEWHEIVK